MLNIVIPMAGRGSRFADAGYLMPKPLISVGDESIIELVIRNLRPSIDHKFIFICQREHLDDFDLKRIIDHSAPNSIIIPINEITQGAACTVLLSRNYIDNDDRLMIANCDQFVDISIEDYLSSMDISNVEGLIMTMKANDPKWSFVGLDSNNMVTRVVEKEVISDEATVGIYNFRRGCDFVRAAEDMIMREERVNGEFYVAPVYNQLIRNGHRVGIFNIGSESNGMYGLGIPKDLEFFLDSKVQEQLRNRISR